MNNPLTFFLLILSFSSLGRVVADMYLPALLNIAESLNTTNTNVQYSISIYFLGLSLSPIFYGALSDHIGRKKPIFLGLFIAIIGSLTCYFSYDIKILILGRFMQGIGCGGSLTLARSISKDVLTSKQLSIFSSIASFANVFLVSLTPLAGSLLDKYFGWRIIFLTQTLYILFVFVFLAAFLPETKPNSENNAEDKNKINIYQSIKRLLKEQNFVKYSSIVFLSYAFLISWNSASSILLQKTFGLTQIQYADLILKLGLVFAFSLLLNILLLRFFNITKILRLGVYIVLLSSVLMLFLSFIFTHNIYAVILPIGISMIGLGFIFSNCFVLALESIHDMSGFASSVYTVLQILGGAFASYIVAYLSETSQLPLTIFLLLLSGAQALFLSL